MPMNKSLQKHVVAQLLEKNGISADTIDIEAEIDSSLTLEENIKLLSSKIGIPLTKTLQELQRNMDKYEWMEDNQIDLITQGFDINEWLNPVTDSVTEPAELEHEIQPTELKPVLIDEEQLEVEYDHDQIERFKEIAKDPLTYFIPYIAPKISGKDHERIKHAILLMLASENDRYGDRNRIHILLMGEPGTAKTEYLLWLRTHFQTGFVGPRTTKVGLTGDARGDEVTPGELALNDGHILAIDELDKFENKDRQSLLESMEEGEYTITAGKHKVRMIARVKIIASANDTSKFSKELLDRFDFKFKLERPSTDTKKEIAKSIVRYWMKPKDDMDMITELREYLSWIKTRDTQIPESVRKATEEIMDVYVTYADKDSEKSIRFYESILRVACAIAKLSYRDVEVGDVFKAIELLDPENYEKIRKMIEFVEKFKK